MAYIVKIHLSTTVNVQSYGGVVDTIKVDFKLTKTIDSIVSNISKTTEPNVSIFEHASIKGLYDIKQKRFITGGPIYLLVRDLMSRGL